MFGHQAYNDTTALLEKIYGRILSQTIDAPMERPAKRAKLSLLDEAIDRAAAVPALRDDCMSPHCFSVSHRIRSVVAFLKEETLVRDSLQWWKDNQHRYKHL